jgi:uncharacterized membrane protein YhiD involved in acid resistance
MEKLEMFNRFLSTQSVHISILEFVINLCLTGFLSFLLAFIYTKYSHSFSNRKSFSRNFILISMTTMLIITIVKSSLALSLGLVGALSIVRFRTAVKEPEELAYLFTSISLGLGLGANQRLITLIGFIIITSVIWILRSSRKANDDHNLFLTISGETTENLDIKQIVEILKKHCSTIKMKRFDENDEIFEASFIVEYSNFDLFHNCKSELKKLNKKISLSYLNNQGIY